jgi:hypothetical protein
MRKFNVDKIVCLITKTAQLSSLCQKIFIVASERGKKLIPAGEIKIKKITHFILAEICN